MREDGWHHSARLAFGASHCFAGQAAFAHGARFHHDPLRDQGGLARGDLLLLSFVFGLAGGLRFPVALFALRAVLLLALSMHAHPRGLGLPAPGGGGQNPLGLGPLRRGHGAGRLAVQIVAAVALAVEQGQPVAIPARVAGQILA